MLKNRILHGDMEYISKNFNKLNAFKNKTILITGCAGFLGFYFIKYFVYLIEGGINIKSLILFDNFTLGKPDWISETKDIGEKIKIYTCDVSRDNLDTILSSQEVDYIIHLASIASPTYYRKYPIQTIDANVWGLRNILDYYKNKSVEGILFFSSSEIYGDPADEFIPTIEEYNGNVSCLGPRACYDEAKRFGETLCYVYANTYNMPICIVRPFNNYGPGMNLNDKRVPADFAKNVINGEDIIIHSDGTPTRTFCYISDGIIGYLKALTYGKFNYFNIGIDTPEISILQFAEIYKKMAKEILNHEINIASKPSQDRDYLTNNPSRRCPNIAKAREILNFNPQIDVEDGVKRFLQYLKEERIDK